MLFLLPYLYKIEYVGTKVVSYSNIQPEYNNRKDIIIYKYVDGKYIKQIK